MSAKKLFLMMAGVLGLSLLSGCEGDGGSSNLIRGSGNLGGTWTGTTAGRPMTMTLEQDGTSLSGTYSLANPSFGEGLSGVASSETAPASATLAGGADRRFVISFDSESSMSGGFYKGSLLVGTVSATQ